MAKHKKMSFEKMRTGFFFGLIIILLLLFLFLLKPFFYPLFWAAITAVVFHPMYRRIHKHIKIESLSAIMAVTLFVVFLILPLTILTLLIVNESVHLYQKIIEGNFMQELSSTTEWLRQSPVGPYVIELQNQWAEYATSASRAIAVFLFENIRNITQNSVKFIALTFIMLYTLYYFFKDGQKVLHKLMHLSPLGNKYEEKLYNKFTSTARATLKSTFIVGGVEGFAGGLLFWITGIEGALIWGVIMAVFAIIPALGPGIVWFPAGIIMLILGNVWQGITILLVGAIIIGLIDNILRPPLVGRDTELHPLMVLLSTLGGLVVFGISGFVIGPIIAALFLSIISIYSYYYKAELDKN